MFLPLRLAATLLVSAAPLVVAGSPGDGTGQSVRPASSPDSSVSLVDADDGPTPPADGAPAPVESAPAPVESAPAPVGEAGSAAGDASSAPVISGPVIQGLVLEMGTGQPLEGVSISVSGREETVDTDERGWYRLELPPGRYFLTFSMPGFKPQKLEVSHTSEAKPRPPLFLEPREDRAAAMVVQTKRPKREMNLEILTSREIERIPGTFGDPVRAIESLPNVARPKFLDGAIVVRGAEPNNTAVLFDGHPVPFLFHFGFWKSVVNPYFVETVRFYPGGMPSSYGNVLQAVLDVRSKAPPRDRVHGVADINLTDSSLTVTAPLFGGRAAIGAAGRFSYLSLFILGVSAAVERDASIFPRYADYNIRFDTELGGGYFTALLFGAKDGITLAEALADSGSERFEQYGIDPAIPYQTQFDHLHLNYRKTLRPNLELYTSTLIGRDYQVSLLPFQEEVMRLAALTRLERWVLGERAEATWKLRPEFTGIAGVDLRYSRAALRDLTELFSSDEVPVPEPEIKPVVAAGAYVRTEWQKGNWLLIPELRGTLYAYNGVVDPFLEPRFTARHTLTSKVSGKASLGLFSQLPEEQEYSNQGNPELRMMKSVQASAGLEASLPFLLELETTAFASRMWDLVLSEVDVVYQQQEWGLTYRSERVYYMGDGWGYGGEVTLKRPLTEEFTGSISYAYTRSLRDSDDGFIPGNYDQPHTLTLLGALRLRNRWVLSGRFRLGSGQPYTPLYGAWDSSSGYYVPFPGELNSARHKFYHQLDVRLDRTILKPRWRMNFYVDVQNVYMARNPIIEIPNWNFTGPGSYVWIPIVPTLGVKGEF